MCTHIGGIIYIVAYKNGGDYICLGDIHTQPTPDGRGEQGPSQPHTSSACLIGHGGLVGSTGLEDTVCLMVDLGALVWG